MSPNQTNKRIAKNTIFLYIRMLMIMAVSLFTVRIILNALGSEDYGINNVVGGIVTMFGFLTGTMVSASQRFFAFEIGRKNYVKLNQYFNITLWCYLGIAVIILIFAETLGLWFLNNKMVIPQERMSAAHWVYQFAVLSFILNMLMIPYNSIIIAREKMAFYAYIGIVEVILKLLIAYSLVVFAVDKLKLYAVLLCAISFLITSIYIYYCRRKFKETNLSLFWDNNMFKEILSYSGWSLFGGLSSVFRNQGINILLNVFFNPIVNAAQAIASQINSSMNQFIANFYKAVQPQIIKQYASGEKESMMNLIFRSSRLGFFLMLLLSLPVLIRIQFILQLWLGKVPEYTIIFTQLVIINTLIESVSQPLVTVVQATGRIKWYQIIVGGLLIFNLPVSYLFLKMGFEPQVTMYIAIFFSFCALAARLLILRKIIGLKIKMFVKNVLLRSMIVSFIPAAIMFILNNKFSDSILNLVILVIISSIMIIVSIYIFGITNKERNMLKGYIHNFINKKA